MKIAMKTATVPSKKNTDDDTIKISLADLREIVKEIYDQHHQPAAAAQQPNK